MAGKLTAVRVRTLTAAGRYGDGKGLWLQVRDAERRSWLLRFKLHGRERAMGLGAVEDVSLAEARAAADEARKLLRQGIDPIDHRNADRAAKAAAARGITFREVAERYIAAHKAGWRNAKHAAQWTSTLQTYAYPIFGDTPVAAVDIGHVMRASRSGRTRRKQPHASAAASKASSTMRRRAAGAPGRTRPVGEVIWKTCCRHAPRCDGSNTTRRCLGARWATSCSSCASSRGLPLGRWNLPF